jgi:spermidine dehydrogenase
MANNDRYQWDRNNGRRIGMEQPIPRRDLLQDVHRPVMQSDFQPGPIADTREEYDLVVVGAGLSGLAAAHFFRQARPGASVLIIDSLDDFGGHANRNEFEVDGNVLIGYGGSQSLDSPDTFPDEVRSFLHDIGVRLEDFYDHYDQEFAADHSLSTGLFFNKEKYGKDELVVERPGESYVDLARRFPLPPAALDGLIRLRTTTDDYLPDKTDQEKKSYLATITYLDYLRRYIQLDDEDAILLVEGSMWGLGIEAVSALDAWASGAPGFAGLALNPEYDRIMGKSNQRGLESQDPYIFHFPDGNAGVARLIVRSLIPEAVPGHTQADSVLASVRYDLLDRPGNEVRVRLNSTCFGVTQDDAGVDVVYATSAGHDASGQYETCRVRAKQVCVAAWNMIAADIVKGLPSQQREALQYSVKVPLLTANVALRSWQPLADVGVAEVVAPAMPWSYGLTDPVSMGGYQFANDASQPVVLHLDYNVPTAPGRSAKDQFVYGQEHVQQTPFEYLEYTMRDLMARSLAGSTFDPARDIAGFTVNRWPQGYAYELLGLWDSSVYGPEEQRPYYIARQPFGRISFANTDSAGTAYADTAIAEAHRAVNDLTGSR